MKLATNIVLSLGLVGMAAACGDDDGGGNGTGSGPGGGGPGGGGGDVQVSSGLPSSQPLSGLSRSDAQTFCQSIEQSYEQAFGSDATRFGCTMTGISQSITADGSVDVSACQSVVDQCMASGGAQGAEFSDFDVDFGDCEDDDDFEEEFAGCNATVADLESCISGMLSFIGQQFSSVTCSTDLASLDEPDYNPSNDPACASLQSQCPDLDLFDDWDDGDDDDWGNGWDDNGWGNGTGNGTGNGHEEGPGCTNTCIFANDGDCDDGGPGADFDFCELGTDCNDCGPR